MTWHDKCHLLSRDIVMESSKHDMGNASTSLNSFLPYSRGSSVCVCLVCVTLSVRQSVAPMNRHPSLSLSSWTFIGGEAAWHSMFGIA